MYTRMEMLGRCHIWRFNLLFREKKKNNIIIKALFTKRSVYLIPQGNINNWVIPNLLLFQSLSVQCYTAGRRLYPWGSLKVRFFQKIKIGFLNPKESENGFCVSFNQINPRCFGSRCIKGTKRIHFQSEFFRSFDAPRSERLPCLVKKLKIRFPILSDLKMQSWIFLKKRTFSRVFSLRAIRDGMVAE